MKIVRMIIGSILLLCTLGLGFVTYLLLFKVSPPHQVELPGYGFIATGYIVLGICLLALVVTILVLPIGTLRDAVMHARQKPAKHQKKRKASNATRKDAAAGDKQPATRARQPSKARTSTTLQMESSPPLPEPVDPEDEAIDTSTYSRLEDPLAMAKLVALDQSDLDVGALREICYNHYPEALFLIDRIMPDCEKTAESLGRQIISIARNKLKMTEKNLADRQFTILQERVFSDETAPIARVYLPGVDLGVLPETHREYVGKIFDKHDWEKAQRFLRADRGEWKEISFASAAEVLSA